MLPPPWSLALSCCCSRNRICCRRDSERTAPTLLECLWSTGGEGDIVEDDGSGCSRGDRCDATVVGTVREGLVERLVKRPVVVLTKAPPRKGSSWRRGGSTERWLRLRLRLRFFLLLPLLLLPQVIASHRRALVDAITILFVLASVRARLLIVLRPRCGGLGRHERRLPIGAARADRGGLGGGSQKVERGGRGRELRKERRRRRRRRRSLGSGSRVRRRQRRAWRRRQRLSHRRIVRRQRWRRRRRRRRRLCCRRHRGGRSGRKTLQRRRRD